MPKTARVTKTTKKPPEKLLKKKRKSIPSMLVKKKPYLELITVSLSIPFLITITLLNLNALKNLNGPPTPTPINPAFQNSRSFYAAPVGPQPSSVVNQSDCQKKLGPVTITSPNENDTVTDNPVMINISYDDQTYCGAAWSYRINGGSWSGYDNRSVALYNLPPGQVTFDLRVRSIATTEERMLTRKFIYNGSSSVFLPNNPNSSGSAN